MGNDCKHLWVSNSGKGGLPDFRYNRQVVALPVMYVMCADCGSRTWMTEDQWLRGDNRTEQQKENA